MAISNRSNEANHRFSLDASLDGRTVLITGGGGGMGGAMADAFLQQGCVVIAAQRNEMATSHERLHFIRCDLSDKQDIEALVDKSVRLSGGVDILINNAAANYNADLRSIDLAAWERLLQINLTAPLQLASGLSPLMKEKGWGRIINISSISAFDNTPFNMLYGATKSALQSFTRSWARQMARFGITVNAVTPGFTETGFTHAMTDMADEKGISPFEAYESLFKVHVPTRRATLPREVAAAALFLCSESSGNITGDVINVSGGQFMTA